jgi:hypothetical protein
VIARDTSPSVIAIDANSVYLFLRPQPRYSRAMMATVTKVSWWTLPPDELFCCRTASYIVLAVMGSLGCGETVPEGPLRDNDAADQGASPVPDGGAHAGDESRSLDAADSSRGLDVAPRHASHESQPADAACFNQETAGATCSPDVPPCPVGDMCCVGSAACCFATWTCDSQTATWVWNAAGCDCGADTGAPPGG